MEQDYKAIGLLHCVDWRSSGSAYHIDHGVSICRYENSDISSMVNKLAKEINFDGREPFGYKTYIQVTSIDMASNIIVHSCCASIIDRVCSLMGITQGGGFPDLCHILIIPSNEKSLIPWIETIPSDIRRPQLETIQNTMYDAGIELTIDDSTISTLKTAWANFINRDTDPENFDRIDNAINFYTNAWRSPTEWEAVLHLSVVLESIFAPHAHSEISHQLALNICKFLRSNLEEREIIYKNVKDFYEERSKVVHGSCPSDFDKLCKNLWNAYSITAEALSKILKDSTTTVIFRNDEKRRRFLHELQLS